MLFVCFMSSFAHSAVGQTEGEQKELVWPQSVRGGGCGRPVEEDREMQQHTQPQMEAVTDSVTTAIIICIKI